MGSVKPVTINTVLRSFIFFLLGLGSSRFSLSTIPATHKTHTPDPCMFLVKAASREANLSELLRALEKPEALSLKELKGLSEALSEQISHSQNAGYWITSLRQLARRQLPELVQLAGEKARVEMKDPRAQFSGEDQTKYEILKDTYSELHKLAKRAYDLRRSRLVSNYHERQRPPPAPALIPREEALRKVDVFLETRLGITERLLRTRHDSKNLGSGGYSDKARSYGQEIEAMTDPAKKQRAIEELREQLAIAKANEKNYETFFNQAEISETELDAITLELSRESNRSVALEEALTAAEGRYVSIERRENP